MILSVRITPEALYFGIKVVVTLSMADISKILHSKGLYKGYRITGPYIRSVDGRYTVKITNLQTNKRSTMSYPKLKMEFHLGRYLVDDETVDHKDGIIRHNNCDNLQVVSRSDHAKLDSYRFVPKEFKCPQCEVSFILEGMKLSNFVRNSRRKKQRGPFCSRSCTGKYGAEVQNGREPKKYDGIPILILKDAKNLRTKIAKRG